MRSILHLLRAEARSKKEPRDRGLFVRHFKPTADTVRFNQVSYRPGSLTTSDTLQLKNRSTAPPPTALNSDPAPPTIMHFAILLLLAVVAWSLAIITTIFSWAYIRLAWQLLRHRRPEQT